MGLESGREGTSQGTPPHLTALSVASLASTGTQLLIKSPTLIPASFQCLRL